MEKNRVVFCAHLKRNSLNIYRRKKVSRKNFVKKKETRILLLMHLSARLRFFR